MSNITRSRLKSLLTKNKFRKFLSKNPNLKMYAEEGDSCAIARYYSKSLNIKKNQIEVDGDIVSVDTATATAAMPLPRWAAKFVNKFDELRRADRYDRTRVSSARAIKILDNLKG